MNKSKLKVRKVLASKNKSKIDQYQDLVIGKNDVVWLLKYELVTTFCSWVPGATGLFLRSITYPWILGSVGENVLFGSNVILRHPHKIVIGNDVYIDDNCLLDAKGVQNSGILIGDGVFVGRNSILSCKDGDIIIGEGANLGFNCEIYSSHKVVVGKDALIAAYCYLIGGGSYDVDQFDMPFAEQDGYSIAGGIEIEENVWLAADVKVLDGVTIGHDSVIGTGAVVRESIPAFSIAAGIPARVLRSRQAMHS